MQGLPLIPGYTFRDPTIEDYKLVHKFDILNGFRVTRDSNIGIGGRPTDVASAAYLKDVDTVQYDPSLTYGRVREYGYRQYIPHYALFAQKCLSFKAFFRQGVFNSPSEHFRIRYVNIVYFLEDDTLSVIEPTTNNPGFQQGKLVKRGKIVKNINGDFIHWKDFNVGIDICIFGVVYHIVDADIFTREFLSSQGIDVGEKEEPPIDPYTEFRASVNKAPMRVTPVPDDIRRRFLEYDKMVLAFTATWNEDVYQIMYFLTDDTVAIREIQKPNSGKDPVVMLLKRMKVPKNWKNLPSSYPAIYMECGDQEIVEYYTPKDFRIGDTIFIFGRRFLLHDCDSFTRKYYSEMLGMNQPGKMPLPVTEVKELPKREPPPHIKFGSPEDTYTSCLTFVPKPPKKDVIRQLLNVSKKLRYSMKMDAVHPEDGDRDFTLEYNLSEGTIVINELEKPNSGRCAGCFLKATLVPKPKTDRNNPEYYTPPDFFIGARINIFNHYFFITGVDLYVYRYMEANPEKFSQEVRDNIRNYLSKNNMLLEDVRIQAKKIEDAEIFRRNLEVPTERIVNDNSDMNNCLKTLEDDARRNYEDDHGDLCFSTLLPQKQCPNLDTQDSVKEAEHFEMANSLKKELRWADQLK